MRELLESDEWRNSKARKRIEQMTKEHRNPKA